MKFKSFFQRRGNGRTTETSCKKATSTIEGKLHKTSKRQNDTPQKLEEVSKTPATDHTDEVLIYGSCKNCGENTYVGVNKALLVHTLSSGEEHDMRVEVKNGESTEVEKEAMKDVKAIRGIPSKQRITMKSPEKIPELMESTKDESDLEIFDEVIELQEKLVAMEAKFAEKQAEWLQLEKDYLLCIRAAERGRVEAVQKLTEAEVNYQALLVEYEKLRQQAFESSPEGETSFDSLGVSGANVQELSYETSGVSADSSTRDETTTEVGQSDTVGKSNGICETAPTITYEMFRNVTEVISNITPEKDVRKESTQGESDTSPINVPVSKANKETQVENIKSMLLLEPRNNPRIIDSLRKAGHGSLRNALLKWCQNQTFNYDVDITNFSSSWKSGLAAAALLHSVCPTAYNFQEVKYAEPLVLFRLAAKAAEDLGVVNKLDIEGILAADTPHWEKILEFVKEVYVAVNKEESPRITT